MRVLLIEDEPRLADTLARELREQGSFAVDVSHDGEDGRHMALTNPYDLILLDLMLPKVGGMKILRDLRAAGKDTPVLILTARDAVEDVVHGLDSGSDDYLTKPFDLDILLARCKALIRRAYKQPDPMLRAGDLEIDTAAHRVRWRDAAISLTAMEYRLLEYLAMRAGQVVSKADISEHLYDFGAENMSNVIEVYISSLRRKLETAQAGRLIHTLKNQGYLLGDAP